MRTKLTNYRELLLIRQKGKRRDVILLGAVFWLIFAALIFLGITDQLTGRSLYVAGAMEVLFGIAYLTAWVQLDRVKAMLELLSNLSDEDA